MLLAYCSLTLSVPQFLHLFNGIIIGLTGVLESHEIISEHSCSDK